MRLPSPWLLLLLLLLAAASVVAFLFATGRLRWPFAGAAVAQTPPTLTATATNTAPPTNTALPTATETPVPTGTSLPPVEYTVATGDTCVSIAVQYDVSWQSIVGLNGLDPNCNLSVGRVLLIPQPTPTPTPLPTATLGSVVSTQVPRTTYTVHANDTLLGIANFYGVTVGDLMEVNGITDATSIREGQVLIIPLERVVTPGPTPTATPPPPWPAPNQLLPADGQILAAGEGATLQWASVGALRPGEFYYVTIEDVTCNCARFYRQPTTDTKLIVPATFQHTGDNIHVYRWTVTTVRQKSEGTAPADFEPAGATSPIRDFVWAGGTGASAP
ncbi:MAG: LysM peptidoglycan-binding domain-containing protein [Anaerolineales bacterium]|nr:LysM peptidoglycan-binding domain-containing protein [Anaerolineales bacterium]